MFEEYNIKPQQYLGGVTLVGNALKDKKLVDIVEKAQECQEHLAVYSFNKAFGNLKGYRLLNYIQG